MYQLCSMHARRTFNLSASMLPTRMVICDFLFLFLQGLIFSAVEVLAISVFVFLVLSYLPPDVSILLLNGVFVVQIIIDIFHTPCRPHQRDSERPKKPNKILGIVRVIFENKFTKLLALGLQVAGIISLAIYLGIRLLYDEQDSYMKALRPIIAFPLVLIVMSFIWSDWIQKLLAKAKVKTAIFHSARYKSSKLAD